MDCSNKTVIIGHVSGAFGIRGWIKITSATDPHEAILNYNPWHLQSHNIDITCKPINSKIQGKSLLIQLEGYTDRDQAATLAGCEIAIYREQLPVLAPGDFYWIDLEGLQVQTTNGTKLGKVSHLLATGANDVLVIRETNDKDKNNGNGDRERLIPYIWDQVIKKVDLENSLLVVDWDADF